MIDPNAEIERATVSRIIDDFWRLPRALQVKGASGHGPALLASGRNDR
jgi:hypothetical protein